FSACDALALALRAVAGLGAGAPGALVALGHSPAAPIAATAAALLIVFGAAPPRDLAARSRPPSRARDTAVVLGMVAIVVAFALAAAAPPLRPPPGRWWLVALDVGQGDALAIGRADGWWLIDAGPRSPSFDAGESIVLPFLRWAGVRRLETLVLTHDDGDHTGGAAALMRSGVVRRVLASPALPAVRGPGSRFHADSTARGERLALDPPMVTRWPPRACDSTGVEIATDNRASLVLEVGEGRGRALLLADADSVVETALGVATRPALLKV